MCELVRAVDAACAEQAHAPRERCAAPQARARSRRGGAVGARETADGGTFGANGAQHSRAEHRLVCQAAYDELEHARRVWVWLTQGGGRDLAPHRLAPLPGVRPVVCVPAGLPARVLRPITVAAERRAMASLECHSALEVSDDGRHRDVLLFVDPPYPSGIRTSVNYRQRSPPKQTTASWPGRSTGPGVRRLVRLRQRPVPRAVLGGTAPRSRPPTGQAYVVRWRYDWADGHVRGVDNVRVRSGQPAESLAYLKG